MDVQRFAHVRPYLYHLTARQNLGSIVRDRHLRSACDLMTRAGIQDRVASRRREHLVIATGDSKVLIRDQVPLAAASIQFEGEWNLERFVAHVNNHVFFWPGTESNPIAEGLSHFGRYRSEGPVVIRVRATGVPLAQLKYCRYNSGAPRCSGGKRSPRGAGTYVPHTHFSGTPSDVVEVVAEMAFSLPGDAEIADSPHGPWRRLFDAA